MLAGGMRGVLSIGVRPTVAAEDVTRIRLLNGLSLAAVALTVASHLGSGFTAEPTTLAISAATLVGFLGVLGLHAATRWRAAAVLFHGVILGSIVAGSVAVNVDFGTFFFLALVAETPFLLLPSRDQALALGIALAAAACLVAMVVGWDVDGDLARRVAVYGRYQLVNQVVLVVVTVLLGYGLRVMSARAEDDLEVERMKSERVLHAVFPKKVARLLRTHEAVEAERHGDASVLFCTVQGLEAVVRDASAEEFLRRLHAIVAWMDRRSAEFGVEKIKTTGATFIAAAGLPSYRPDHAEVLVGLALALQEEFARTAGPGLTLRCGINSGPVVAGMIGHSRPTYDIWGDTVNMAQRMDVHGEAGRVHVTPLTFAKINHRFECAARDLVQIKGRGAMKTYFVVGARGRAGG